MRKTVHALVQKKQDHHYLSNFRHAQRVSAYNWLEQWEKLRTKKRYEICWDLHPAGDLALCPDDDFRKPNVDSQDIGALQEPSKAQIQIHSFSLQILETAIGLAKYETSRTIQGTTSKSIHIFRAHGQKPRQPVQSYEHMTLHHNAVYVVDMSGAQQKGNFKFYQTVNGCSVFDTFPEEYIKKVVHIRDKAENFARIRGAVAHIPDEQDASNRAMEKMRESISYAKVVGNRYLAGGNSVRVARRGSTKWQLLPTKESLKFQEKGIFNRTKRPHREYRARISTKTTS